MLDWLNKFHGTRWGLLAFAVITLGLSYASISWAFNSGSWLAYLLTLLFFVAFLQNALKLLASLLLPTRRHATKGLAARPASRPPRSVARDK